MQIPYAMIFSLGLGWGVAACSTVSPAPRAPASAAFEAVVEADKVAVRAISAEPDAFGGGGNLQIYVGERLIADDRIRKTPFADDTVEIHLRQKAEYLSEVVSVAAKHGAKVRIYTGAEGHKWIEPIDEAIRAEVARLFNWDGQRGGLVRSVRAAWVTVHNMCLGKIGGFSSNAVNIQLFGRLYERLEFSANPFGCRGYVQDLEKTLADSAAGFVMLYRDSNGLIQIEAAGQ